MNRLNLTDTVTGLSMPRILYNFRSVVYYKIEWVHIACLLEDVDFVEYKKDKSKLVSKVLQFVL